MNQRTDDHFHLTYFLLFAADPVHAIWQIVKFLSMINITVISFFSHSEKIITLFQNSKNEKLTSFTAGNHYLRSVFL